MADASGARERGSRTTRCCGRWSASSPSCRCCRSRGCCWKASRRAAQFSGDGAAPRPVEPDDLDGDAAQPRDRVRRHGARRRARDASSRWSSSLTDIRARNAFVFCFVLPLMLAPQVVALAWLQMFGPSSPLLKLLGIAPALGQPQSALFARRHHPAARRPVRAARVPHAARRPAHAAAGAARGGARRRRAAAARAAHHRAAADDAAARRGRRAVLRLLPRQLRHPRASSASRATTSCCRRSSTSGSPDSARACCPRSRCSRC